MNTAFIGVGCVLIKMGRAVLFGKAQPGSQPTMNAMRHGFVVGITPRSTVKELMKSFQVEAYFSRIG